ncbi:MAG: TonB-dependent receptor plug domain-containing protein [Paludibacteraceae bacterium]
MRKFHVLFLFTCILVTQLFAQKTITGVVTSSEDNSPLIGVSVIVKGTTRGVLTNIDGKFSISVSSNEKLVFTYVGMLPQEILVGNQSTIDVVLKPDSKVLDEVVVTAMGIQQEKKRMNFAVQNVSSEALTESRSSNFVNALQGKIAGLSVTTSSGSPNAGSQVIIRGISSVNNAQNNEPLFILDGVPISGKGTSAADINPNDIESTTVLKGAAAAALYGQDAANGVIMITTKKGQIGKVKATVNASWQQDTPTRLQAIQTSYAPGSQGFYSEEVQGGWGPLLNNGEQTYNNINSFLNNGFYQKYDISLTGGSEKFQSYASASYSKNDGIVPNDYLNKFNALLKGTYQPIKTLSFTFSANVSENTYRSFSATGMSSVYNFPITTDIRKYELPNGYPLYSYYDSNKRI